ncbi:SymE family type I addiction module toxin [Xenorhabdus griffiniae]|uniref:SymE family type I addiction module toxin n=1 Tax=Xenorhabdus griffiniae TaxID=351672 RepID=UPI0030D13DC2
MRAARSQCSEVGTEARCSAFWRGPAINLAGRWLKQAEFDIGGTLTVKIMDGCLVLIPDSETPAPLSNSTSASKTSSVRLSSRCGNCLAATKAAKGRG